MKDKVRFFVYTQWALTIIAVFLPIAAWLHNSNWQIAGTSPYRFFPLFGLLAFSIMWSHYVSHALRLYMGVKGEVSKTYKVVTGWTVLAALFLHPGILSYQLWRDGFGLPPNSYLNNYVSEDLVWAVGMGTIAWFFFLAYELHRWFSDRKWWKHIQALSDVAMALVLIHGFELGGDLQTGWFRSLWLVYAELYAAALFYIYWKKYKLARNMLR